jgi:hypothetical protein
MSKGYISNFEDLEYWFRAVESPKWNLYRGHHEKMNNMHMIAKLDDEDVTVDESWEQLRRMIEINSKFGGTFTVYANNTRNNRNQTAHVAINTPGPAMAGLGGMPGMYGGYGMGMIPAEEVENRIRKEREIWDLKSRIENMEAESESRVGFMEKVFEKVIQDIDFNNLGKALSAILMSRTAPAAVQAAQVNLQGVPEDQTNFEYATERIVPFLDRIRPHFSDDESFYSFLDRVVDFFEKNPEMSKGFFGPKTAA